MSYSDLTETEQHYFDEYGTLRAITDWAGFTDAQENRKTAARDWLVNQRKEIWRCAEGKKQCAGGAGWDVNNRAARYETLKDESLNTATAKHEYTLPANGCTDTEKSYIEEREGYLMIGGDGASADDAQKKRKTANSDWLVSRRKQVWHLGEDEGWDEAERELRYENLCIATHYGSQWDSYEKTHNKYGQAVGGGGGGGSSAESARARCVENCRSYLGVNENPAGSNRGPEIDGWNKRAYGGVGVPWCASFASCMAWDAGVKGSGSAGVQVLVDMARAGTGMMRGWTTDPSVVLRGDFAVISCTSCHVEVVIDSDDAYDTIGGNTSPGSEGSQYDGGCVAHRQRNGEVVGWCLVDYPS
jgi:hypothetical protein